MLIEIIITNDHCFTLRQVQLVSQVFPAYKSCKVLLKGQVVSFLDSYALLKETNQWTNLGNTQLGFCFVFTPTKSTREAIINWLT